MRNRVIRSRKIFIQDAYKEPDLGRDNLIKALQQMTDDEWIQDIKKDKGEYVPWMAEPGEVRTYSHFNLYANKYEPETDEEYFTRMKDEETRKKASEEQERLTYLRLKAKFEPDNI